jgi:hypothetical protein
LNEVHESKLTSLATCLVSILKGSETRQVVIFLRRGIEGNWMNLADPSKHRLSRVALAARYAALIASEPLKTEAVALAEELERRSV